MNKLLEIYDRLEQDDVLRDIRADIRAQTRERLSEIDPQEHPWKALCRPLAAETVPEDGEIASMRMAVAQEIADILFQEDGLSWKERIQWKETPDDMLALFAVLRIPGKKWASSNWMNKGPVEDGQSETRRTFGGLLHAIRSQHPGPYSGFRDWMEEKPEPTLRWVDRVRACETPEHFLELFRSLGIPGDKWKSGNWLKRGAERPIQKGGIGVKLDALCQAIYSDPRFEKSYLVFLRWMGHEPEEKFPYAQRVEECEDPEDFLALFEECEVKGDAWKYGKNLPLALFDVIRYDERFGKSYKKFVIWMDGQDGVTGLRKRVNDCVTREDFLALFTRLGIPDDKWKISSWIHRVAKKPALVKALRLRFGSHPAFVAWMEGVREKIPLATSVYACETTDSMRAFFAELGIPDERWRSHAWLARTAAESPENGGIGKSLIGLSKGVLKDPRFQRDFSLFVAWMDGYPLEGIESQDQAVGLLRKESARLNVPLDELLDPEKAQTYCNVSPLLQRILDYFDQAA